MDKRIWRYLPLLTALLIGPALEAQAEALTRAPYLQMGSATAMTVRWRTDVATSSAVAYGTVLNTLSDTETNTTVSADHSVRINGLAPNTKYYYAVLDENSNVLRGDDSAHYFYTSPVLGATDPTRVWVIGDSGTANANAVAVSNAYLARTGSVYTNLWIMLGDNAYNHGTDAEYQLAVFNIYTDLLRQSPLWSTLGNHDGHSADSASQSGPYYDIFSLPGSAEVGGVPSGTEAYYSFDYGQIHFVCLESYETNRSSNSAMLTWLENDLQATTQPWIIAYWHHPPYSKGSHNSDTELELREMRENALPILESYGVDLVLSGHSHSYERSYLLDGHYGDSLSFTSSMALDAGDGQEDGDGAYSKIDRVKEPRNGAVYVVAGNAGKTSGGNLDHPAMYASINALGSMILEVAGNQLSATFIDQNNTIRDYFTVEKGVDTLAPTVIAADAVDNSTVTITYSEKVEQVSASQPSNYTIDPAVTVLGAALDADQRIVTLSTTDLAPATDYTVTINGVEDLAGNSVAVDTQAGFSYVNLITVEFQDGVVPAPGYAGTRDAYISEANPTVNNGSLTTLLLDGDDGGGVDLSSLLRWDINTIPGDAIIESASISFEVFDPSTNSYSVFALGEAWVEAEVSWNNYAAGAAWQSPGAKGSADRGALALASVSPGTGIYTANLNVDGVATVQAWVDGSAANYGLLIADASATNGVDFYSRESGNYHPRLTVVYSLPVTGGDSEAPSSPGNLQAGSVTTSSIALSWDASSDNVGVIGYKIMRGGVMIDSSSSTSYVNSGLSAATSYSYVVTAFDAANNESGPSTPLNVTTDATIASIHIDGINMSLAQVGRKKLRANAQVAIADGSGSAIANASVEGSWSGLTNQSVSGLTLGDGSISFSSGNVNNNTSGEFAFTVSSVSAAGYAYDEQANLETGDCISSAGAACDDGSLAAPTGLNVDFDGTQVNLDWQDVAQADSYIVYRSLVSGPAYVQVGSPSGNNFIDSNVAADTTYYYVVTALSGAEESAHSDQVEVTTTVAPSVLLGAESVSLSLKAKGKKYDVTALISVLENGGNPASGAQVTGDWFKGEEHIGTDQVTTGANGKASIKLSRVSAQSDDVFTFTVTDIQRGGDSYDGVTKSGSVTVL